MPSVNKTFSKYVLYYTSGGSAAVGMPYDAAVDLFDETGARAGAIYFYPPTISLPKNNSNANGIYLYMATSRFADVMSILRNEKPLYISLNTETGAGYIGTSTEPIGEGEPTH